MAKYESTTGKGECIFCKIASGEIKTPGIFWEDKNFMAFLSIFPNTEGYTVLIPKKHYGSDVLVMPDTMLQKFIIATKKVSNILLQYFDDVGRIGLMMEGTGVDHAHIKLSPMHGTAHMKKGLWKQHLNHKTNYFKKYEGYITSIEGPKAEPKKLEKLATKLKALK
jgi:diadenosine tetraphosphate (Ap4A) HIT family hydrolase